MMILLMCTTSFALSFQPVSVILDSALVPFISLFIDIEHALCSLATFSFFFFFFPSSSSWLWSGSYEMTTRRISSASSFQLSLCSKQVNASERELVLTSVLLTLKDLVLYQSN